MGRFYPALDKKRRMAEEIKRPMEKLDGVVEGKYFVGGRPQGKLGYIQPTRAGRHYQDDQEAEAGKLSRNSWERCFSRIGRPKIKSPECDCREPGKRYPRAVQVGGNNPAKYTAESEWNR